MAEPISVATTAAELGGCVLERQPPRQPEIEP
jgi:hypothetical protein